jgi:DNA-binding MarR family transcriptional regulator
VIERVDLESRSEAGDHLSLRLWLRLLSVTNLIEGRARSRLRREFATTLARFDFLAQLERRPEGLTMSDLSRRLMVTGGNVTRLADQLESEAFVVREVSGDDRRVIAVRMTAAGRRAFAAMAAQHETWIVEMFGDLSSKERASLYTLLAKLKRRIARTETEQT